MTRFVLAAMALHGLVLALLPREARPPLRAPAATLAFELRASPSRPPVVASLSPSRTPPPRRVEKRREAEPPRPATEAPGDAERPREAEPPPATGDTAPAPTPAPVPGDATRAPEGAGARSGGPVDLFSRGALETATGIAAADRERARVDDTARLRARVQGFIDDAMGRERAQSGRVDPEWRALERQIDAGFRPPAEVVTDHNRVVGLLRQYATNLGRAPGSGRGDGNPDRGDRADLRASNDARRAEIAAGVEGFARPSDWRRVEIDVLIDADGQVRDLRVVTSSGREAFDQAALAAAERAAHRHAPRGRRRRARFAVEAAVGVEPPQVTPTIGDATGKPNGAVVKLFGLDFDANFGVKGFGHALRKTVHTRVSLVSVADE